MSDRTAPTSREPPDCLSATVVEHLRGLARSMGTAQFALEVLEACLAEEVGPPRWVLEEIAEGYRAFRDGTPVAGWRQVELNQAAPRTLGEAFGVPDLKAVGAMTTRRKKALLLPSLLSMFSGPNALPRTDSGYRQAAAAHGITAQQVKDWLPKTRSNVRGHKPQRIAPGGHLQALISPGAKVPNFRKKRPL